MVATPRVAAFVHESVLLAEVLEYLSPRDGEVFVDGTVGGGGHAAAILAIPGTHLIGVDRDPGAVAAATDRLAEHGDRAHVIHGELADLPQILAGRRVAGILVDLGVSSPQLDQAARGFSFSQEGPLDMRMDPTRGPTVLELLRELDVDDLGEVISEYGEERHAKKIARAIKEAVREDKLRTTTELARVVAAQIPTFERLKSRIHPATRTFQAIRIAVNQELDQLDRFLAAFPDLLAPGGRCVAISFHSLEDRRVKHAFRDLAWSSSLPPRLAAEAGERAAPVCEPLTRKAVFASDAEVERNPRARSARLRACVRTDAPNLPTGRAAERGRPG